MPREDCNGCLDAMVENISAARSISILTGEILTNKSPVIRTTVARLLALVTDRYSRPVIRTTVARLLAQVTDRYSSSVSRSTVTRLL